MKSFFWAWVLVMVFYGIDCILITPLALIFFPVEEVGFVLSFLFSYGGVVTFYLWYFFIFAPLSFGAVFILWFGLELTSLPKWSKIIIFWTIVSWFCILMLFTIIHNSLVIKPYI
jgi:hypothetical protein